ncbi:hypothetical protein ACFX5Q_23460 [Mesorhizobium sp. IMUNJ 23033]|uniref:hypothetical protein n=1 Tax=Mesorhizobium sp. IMUNJ 23033 TaxID=3378039 RepID=UPI00384AC99E
MSGKARAGVIALPVIGALFGSQAFQLGQIVLRGFNLLAGNDRNPASEVQAGLLAIGIGLLVVVAATSALSKQDGEADDHLIATIVTTVVAGAFSILKETQDPTLTGSAWMYAIFVAAVAVCRADFRTPRQFNEIGFGLVCPCSNGCFDGPVVRSDYPGHCRATSESLVPVGDRPRRPAGGLLSNRAHRHWIVAASVVDRHL